MSQNTLENIYFRDRKGVRDRILRQRSQRPRVVGTRRYAARHYRNSRDFYVSAERRLDTRTDFQLRTFTTTLRAPWKQRLRSTGIVRSTQVVDEIQSFETFRNQAFSLEVPTSVRLVEGQAHNFTGENGNFDLRIAHFENACEGSTGFMGCAIQIAVAQNHALVDGAGKLLPTERIIRQSTTSDTVLDRLNIITPVYTEQITAFFIDGKEYTLFRYLVKEQGKGVYLVEIKVPKSKSTAYVQSAKRIFDSFRIYPETSVE